MLKCTGARIRPRTFRCKLLRWHEVSQVTGDVCSKWKKLTEWGYASMFLHHIIDQKMHMSKSERQPFAQEAPRSSQVSPKGPTFWSQKFSYIILRWCVFMIFLIYLPKIKVYLVIQVSIWVMELFHKDRSLKSLNKLWIIASKSKNTINTHHLGVIWEKFWDQNFGPLGLT